MDRIGSSEPADDFDKLLPHAPDGDTPISGLPITEPHPPIRPVDHEAGDD